MVKHEWEITVDRHDGCIIIEHLVFDAATVESEEDAKLFLRDFKDACEQLGWKVDRK